MNSTLINNEKPAKTSYKLSEWERYARVFASVTTPAQVEVYEKACPHLYGNVLDAGAGTGKLAHYLNNNPKIESYTGVDFSKEMVEVGNEIMQCLQRPSFKIKHCEIESTVGIFNSAVSIQSFYTWPNPQKTLASIYKLLEPGAIFVLATANNNLNLQPLIKDANKVLAGHPNIEDYKQLNIKLAERKKGNFTSLDELIHLVQNVGFSILEANQKYFHGGINFLVLQKTN